MSTSTAQVIIALLLGALLIVAYDDYQQRKIAEEPLVDRVCKMLLTAEDPPDETAAERSARIDFTQGFCSQAFEGG